MKNKFIKNNIGIIIGAILLISFFSWMMIDYHNKKNSLQEVSRNLFYMDTYINVKVYTKDKEKAQKILNEVDKIYSDYHNLTDRYNSYEGIVNLYTINNNNLKTKSLTIDEKLYKLLQFGIESYDKSNKLLDINLGHVIDVWKKYRENKNGIPTTEELKKSGSTNIKDIKLLDNNQIENDHPSIDLGALVKGYVTQLAADYLKDNGFDKFLINAGGNVIVGNHYANDLYKIGIETPTSSGGIYDIVKCTNKAITTSGNYERFYEYNGVLYHHIIDPNTLFPTQYMKSVTVITDDGAIGDMLSTTLFLMSIEDGKKYLKENFPLVEAIWYGMDDQITKTDGFSKYE